MQVNEVLNALELLRQQCLSSSTLEALLQRLQRLQGSLKGKPLERAKQLHDSLHEQWVAAVAEGR